jgi:peptidyl-prolyl cis-trans isomerase D
MVNIDFVLFSPEKYTKIDPSDKELKAYFDAHSADYKTKPEVKVRYVAFRPEDFEKQVTVPKSDIAEYYDEHPDQFRIEKTVQARHILIKVAKDAPADKVAEARKKIEAILKLARSGKDFASLAKKYSEGPSRDRGGELGAFTKESMVKPFADKAFSMKPGQISDPVRTRFGWHIIKVEKVNKASMRTLDQASPEIRARLTKKMADEMAANAAEKAYDTAFSDGDLQLAATGLKLALKTTDFFDRQGSSLSFEGAAKFADAAFQLEDKDVSSVIKCPDAYYVLQRMETKPSVVPALETVKAAVRKDLIHEQQKEKAKADAQAFLSAVKGGADMAAEAAKYHLKVQSSGFFKRGGRIPQIGNDPQMTQSAFTLTAAKRFPDTVLEGPKGDYVIAFKERKEADPTGLAAEKDQIAQALRKEKEREYYTQWIDKLRAKSVITINDAYKNMN